MDEDQAALDAEVTCPTCGRAAERAHFAGRTTWWLCPNAKCEQRTWGTTPPVHTHTRTSLESAA